MSVQEEMVSISKEEYLHLQVRAFRVSEALNRFKRQCSKKLPKICWNCDSEKDLTIHHIKSVKECFSDGKPEQARDFDNIIWLCKRCHVQFHKDFP